MYLFKVQIETAAGTPASVAINATSHAQAVDKVAALRSGAWQQDPVGLPNPMIRTISGRCVDVRLTPDQLDALIDALDGLHQLLNGWEAHEALRRHSYGWPTTSARVTTSALSPSVGSLLPSAATHHNPSLFR